MQTQQASEKLRGVFQDVESWTGVAVIRCVDSAGCLRLKVEMLESDIAEGDVERLEAWLDAHDPPPAPLRVLR